MTRDKSYQTPSRWDLPPQTETALPAYSTYDDGQPPPAQSPPAVQAQTSYPTAEEEKSRSQGSNIPVSISSSPKIVEVPSGASSDSQGFRGLRIPSKRRYVTSGFPYPSVLAEHDVSIRDWSLFTSEITEAAQLHGGDWAVAVGAGVGAFCVSGVLIGWMGFFPAVVIPALLAGDATRRRLEVKNLETSVQSGALQSSLAHWNKDFFASRGLMVVVESPRKPSDFGEVELLSEGDDPTVSYLQDTAGATKDLLQNRGFGAKGQPKQDRCLRKMCCKTEKWEKKLQAKQEKHGKRAEHRASKKGRIVIIPLDQAKLDETQQTIIAGHDSSAKEGL
ncbi:MAG: hypothetical protein M1837_004667 [Sclerophora amabilis]|nr:MAG: hypothetical protein M1837_004667 [Sclerophora amabilis]